MVSAFGIVDKVCAIIVHDQAANMESFILNNARSYESVCCNAHHLQLYLGAGFTVAAIERLVKAASKPLGHSKHSVGI